MIKYTVNTTYDKLKKLVKKIIKDSGNTPALCFSMFESIDDSDIDKWMVRIPDLESNTPVFKGNCQFRSSDVDYTSRVIKNPTWKDIILEANMAVLAEDGDHVFLESIKEGKISKHTGAKVYQFWFGS